MTKKEFAKRRQQLMGIMGPNSIAVLPNAEVANRNRDVDYPYRSDSNFHYLSGFDEPESVIVIIPGRAHGEYLLFCRERNLKKFGMATAQDKKALLKSSVLMTHTLSVTSMISCPAY